MGPVMGYLVVLSIVINILYKCTSNSGCWKTLWPARKAGNMRRKWMKLIKKRALSFDEVVHPMDYSRERGQWTLRSDLYLVTVTFCVKIIHQALSSQLHSGRHNV